MTDTDRRLDDIEKRLAALEKSVWPLATAYLTVARPTENEEPRGRMGRGVTGSWQFCACGRDVCRAPDCPSHRNDPLGR